MFYVFIRELVRILIFILNGRPQYLNKEKLPKGNYILVGPHRSWLDPLFFALAASPKKFAFMAKKELFKNPVMNFILKHANTFPIDRNNPGPSAIKTPIKILKKTSLSLIMFPSGSRHSQKLKGGSLLIAKLSNVPIVPVSYQGPLTFVDLIKRKKAVVSFGNPIYLNQKQKLDEKTQKELLNNMQKAFNQLDASINPNYQYIDPNPKK